MKHSVWWELTSLPSFTPLQGDKKTDVLIIGGGMAGLLCAHMLKQARVSYILVEADRLCSGVTKNTTAKITAQHGLIYHKLLRRFGMERTRMYLEANLAAIREFRTLCGTIDCAFEEQTSCVYSQWDAKKTELEITALDQLGFDAEYLNDLPIPISVAGAVQFRRQAQFHPLRFAAGLVKGLNIYEHTKVRELRGMTAITDHGSVTASKIIVATHFPFLNKHGSYFLKLYQHRSYVLALEGTPPLRGMYVDESDAGLSFRPAGDLLLLGGGGHRTGKTGGSWAELSAFALEHYPKAAEVRRWAAQDCMSLDQIPYVGQYSRCTPNLYVATGFNKWGMTNSMAAAMILRDMVLERENPWAEAFSPSRSILHPQLAVNALESTVGLLTPSRKRCPHLGCALKWNPREHSWDCPCHGSRFEENGQLIDNPATDDLPQKH